MRTSLLTTILASMLVLPVVAHSDDTHKPLSRSQSVEARATVRELDGLVSAMRIIRVVNGVDAAVYEIKAVLPDPTFKRHLTLMLGSGVSNG